MLEDVTHGIEAKLAGLVIILGPGMVCLGPTMRRREQELGAVGIDVIGKPDPPAVPSGVGVLPPNAERDVPPPVGVHRGGAVGELRRHIIQYPGEHMGGVS